MEGLETTCGNCQGVPLFFSSWGDLWYWTWELGWKKTYRCPCGWGRS